MAGPVPPPAPPRGPTRPAAVVTTARRRTLRGPLALLLALLLVAGVGVGAWWFGWARYTSTPGVLGLDEQAATAKLEKAGLSAVAGDPAYSENVEEGLVISTLPAPGDRVLDGGEVTLVLSLGPERYDVPKLRGKSEDEAQDLLAATNLVFGSSTEKWSEKIPAGDVIRSTPKTGTTLKPGATVDLVLSKGRRPIPVDDWTGKPYSEARSALERKKLRVTVASREFSDTVPQGSIISQDPVDGTLHRGDTVTFVVSRGPQMVEVPNVRGWGVDDAVAALEEQGFEVVTKQTDGSLGLGYVFSMDPAGGQTAPKGSTITLYLI